MDLAAELSRYGPTAQAQAVTLAEAQAYCRRLARGHYENFTVVSRLFPNHLRQHLANVYAYCRWADDLADETGSATRSLALLDWWEAQLDGMFAGHATHPVFVALSETASQFDLRRQPLADLLAAFRRDQTQTRYETMSDLLSYCEKSASPVGRIVLCLGRSQGEENVACSDAICTGLQLANLWQDVRRDYDKGRIYIPREILARYGVDDLLTAARQGDDAFRKMMEELVAHAEAMLVRGKPLVDRVNADLRLPVEVFLEGGRAVLAAIRAARYDVWSRRPTVGRLVKLRLLAKAWWRR